MDKIIINGKNLDLNSYISIVRRGASVELSEESKTRVIKSREYVEKIIDNKEVIYGITTGFGRFSDVMINSSEIKKLQRNLIISHSCGVGNPLSEEIVRGIMLLRVNALANGYSGIRLSTMNILIQMINKGVHPVIPEKGSLGASGDLAPLAHMVLVMIGEGEAYYKGERLSGKIAMDRAGIEIVELVSKEGLALINGTQVMTAIGALAIYDSIILSKTSDIAAALTIEALNGITDAFDPKIQLVRGHKGQINSANNLLKILANSNLTTKQGEQRVQDAYSLRCTPQIHGASKDALYYIKDKIEIEMNAVTDNPLIFIEEGEVISGGNFHGQPMALALDFLAIALSEFANISERRLERLVNPSLSNGLPPFLTKNGGVNSGFMIVQYSAASLVSENKILAHPASVDSIPSSANQEDHVSMGTISARKASEILGNAQKVVSMEMLTACQAIDLRDNKGLGIGTRIAYDIIRKEVSELEEDRIMYLDINKVVNIILSEEIVKNVEAKIGEMF
ncbi:MAG: histidine ammonia-lyase [Gudongella sp.]|nr:histidine ammonia-lyase [Gudongella sp.]